MIDVTKLISLDPVDIEELDAAAMSELTWLLPRGGLTFDPVLGSIEALISSGQLNRVRNLQVRSLIGAWPALMDEKSMITCALYMLIFWRRRKS